MGEDFSLEDIFIIARRRILYFLIPFVLIAIVGVAVVMLMPAKYTASGTILVESQQIPSDLVRSTINAYAQERIQTIRQRVMTQSRLIEVADKFRVFADQPGLSESEQVRQMRQSTRVDLIQVDRRSSRGDGTIAFTVSYKDQNARTAYLVANEIMTLFLSEDVRTRTAGASNTTEFFEREATRVREEVSALEGQIAAFKQQNARALPEHLNMHLSALQRANADLQTLLRTNEGLEEERSFLESQIVSGVQSEGGLAARLAAKEAELATLRATFSNDYPDVQTVRNEISAIRASMAPSQAVQRLRGELAAAERQVDSLERQGVDPDSEEFAQAVAAMDSAREALSDQISKESRAGSGDISSVQMESRIAIIDNRIRSNERDAVKLRAQIDDLEERVAETPDVERSLATLTREQQNLYDEYQELRAKQQDAQLAETLEENQQAEKFSILEPASRPDRPSEPDRPKMLVLALFLAGAAGGGLALLMEILFATVRGQAHLAGVLGEHPLAVISYIDVDEAPSKRRLPFIRLPRFFSGDGGAHAGAPNAA